MIPPAGVVPLGSFVETISAPAKRPVPILADYTDPLTGEVTQLNRTRTPVDGAIIEVLRVERNSGPAVREVGHTLREVRHTDDSSLAELRGRLRDGLRRMERAGWITLLNTEVKRNQSRDGVEMTGEIQDKTAAQLDTNRPEIRTYAVPRGTP
jgi:hypothetical protein